MLMGIGWVDACSRPIQRGYRSCCLSSMLHPASMGAKANTISHIEAACVCKPTRLSACIRHQYPKFFHPPSAYLTVHYL